MKTMLKLALLAGAAWSAAATTVAAQDAAPAAGAPGTAVVEELIVTARRREETLKDVPVAVSAFSAETLERQAANDITTLSQTMPNITVQTARGSNSTLISYIRGIGQQDPLWGYEPGVGLYVDDVYIYRPQGAVLDVFDVSRIEVLRGPQGTLLRPQHHRRRDQVRDQPPGRRGRRQGPRHVRQLQPDRPAGGRPYARRRRPVGGRRLRPLQARRLRRRT